MAEERTLEDLLKIIQEQAATIKHLLEENALQKKRIEQLERQVKR